MAVSGLASSPSWAISLPDRRINTLRFGLSRSQQRRAGGQHQHFAIGERLGEVARVGVAEQGNPLDFRAAPVAAPPILRDRTTRDPAIGAARGNACCRTVFIARSSARRRSGGCARPHGDSRASRSSGGSSPVRSPPGAASSSVVGNVLCGTDRGLNATPASDTVTLALLQSCSGLISSSSLIGAESAVAAAMGDDVRQHLVQAKRQSLGQCRAAHCAAGRSCRAIPRRAAPRRRWRLW